MIDVKSSVSALSLQSGVTGSVLGTKRFLVEYADDVSSLLERLHYHLFADDMQGFQRSLPANVPQIASTLADCAADVSAWCAAKRLQLNAEKAEVMWFGSSANLRKIPCTRRWQALCRLHHRRTCAVRPRP